MKRRPTDKELRRWASWQRSRHRCGRLNQVFKERLDQILGWSWDRLAQTPDHYVPIAERLAEENDGRIPKHAWLVKNGYVGLQCAISSHPEYFSHLPQEKGHKTPEEWVSVAERLAEENNGTLPSYAVLAKNYSGLVRIMAKIPRLFSHVPRRTKKQATSDNLLLAVKLAKDAGGVLPSSGWLTRNGYHNVFNFVYLHAQELSTKFRKIGKGNNRKWVLK